jgi:hypothetical protein
VPQTRCVAHTRLACRQPPCVNAFTVKRRAAREPFHHPPCLAAVWGSGADPHARAHATQEAALARAAAAEARLGGGGGGGSTSSAARSAAAKRASGGGAASKHAGTIPAAAAATAAPAHSRVGGSGGGSGGWDGDLPSRYVPAGGGGGAESALLPTSLTTGVAAPPGQPPALMGGVPATVNAADEEAALNAAIAMSLQQPQPQPTPPVLAAPASVAAEGGSPPLMSELRSGGGAAAAVELELLFEQLQRLLQQPEGRGALKTLQTVCENILKTPAEPKFRSLKLSNPKIAQRLVRVPGALACLDALGFRATVSRPFPSWHRSILTEIYLCHACACQEILRAETRSGSAPRRSRRR